MTGYPVWCFSRQVEGKMAGFSLSGMKTKLFGNDTPEQRDQKIKQLDEQIKDTEEQLKTASSEAE